MSITQENKSASITSYVYQQTYDLKPGTSQVTITLISKGASFSTTESIKTFNTGTIGNKNSKESFTVYSNGEFVYALIETQYKPVTRTGHKPIDPPSYCHIYFKPGGTNWLWSTDAQTADNDSIFPGGQGERTGSTITIQSPTDQNPSSLPSTLPNLNSELVFLLDKNVNGNMLFRGNEPLKPGLKCQDIDFHTLHNCLKTKYQLQTGLDNFPEMGKYVLRDIAFLGHNINGELPILLAEVGTFGALELSQVDQKWYPASPKKFSSGMKAQVSNWNVEPAETSTALDIEMIKNLSTWMKTDSPYKDANHNPIPVIYYIHCSSGHDRTGMISSGYLMHHYGLGLTDAFILGTTIHKLNASYGGNLVTNCEDFVSKEVDSNRSRCFVAGTQANPTYNNGILNIYNTLHDTAVTELPSKAVSGDPAIKNTGQAYVFSHYPWDFVAQGYATMVAGVVVEIGILIGGCGYTEPPVITIEAPSNGGMTATATAEITNGIVTDVTMTNQGSGYDFSPQVSFSSPNPVNL
ncbi:hypothetical protein [Aquimarina megaterium]|uniref:hypothetical protein n=1 Tax=Aquimarina megaterium TaxID=1443666 RepID=UPI00094571D6|nr:hypothetical protein [Aquimarina megaterium]